MISLEITREEKEVLIEYLDRDIANLRSEISHTDSHDYKENLKKTRDVLQNILQRIRG